MSAAKVRSAATRCPVCQTPPRVVTHQIWVLNPKRIASHSRSTSERTPILLISHQHSPTSIAARPALIPVCHDAAVRGPTIATRGISPKAGNGAKGT